MNLVGIYNSLVVVGTQSKFVLVLCHHPTMINPKPFLFSSINATKKRLIISFPCEVILALAYLFTTNLLEVIITTICVLALTCQSNYSATLKFISK